MTPHSKALSLLWLFLCAALTVAVAEAPISEAARGIPSPALREWLDPANPPPPPQHSLGYPSRAPELDALPGFREPPPGYGEVPFWWWTGDPLEPERLLWQIEKLHEKGISGVQVNYAHEDTPGWPTYAVEPPIFSDHWWDMWKFVAGECGKRDMGIGLSGYTLDWPNGRSLVSRTIYSDPDIEGRELQVAGRVRVTPAKPLALELPPHTIAAKAYPWRDGALVPQPRELPVPSSPGQLAWTPAEGEWEVWVFVSQPKAGALNPMHPLAGRRVVDKFFQRFQDHAPGRSSQGLNYFFHDELQFGVGDHIWTDDFASEFRARKGYDVFDALPALFSDVGPRTPKFRLDYMDVRMRLIQERYFIPIFQWQWSRGLIFGCDQGSRGRDPMEFGDYFGAVRWYTAPGHDTPGGQADLIKGKVSSSIAQLYRRPRVWLEGYHSLGWGAAPERLMHATCENFLFGCNLLNLHGLYYSTHGSFWEWAPPCYHFRMPYWDHLGTFLKYFERLSYLLSQGVHQCDVAVLYPVTPGQAGLDGSSSANAAFELGTRLHESGRDFIYIDDDSLARATFKEGRLHVSEASYRVLILPAMRAVRWSTIKQAQAFHRAGGLVIAAGALPEASDRMGRDDQELDDAVRNLFGASAADLKAGKRPAAQANGAGGLGLAVIEKEQLWAGVSNALRTIPLEVVSDRPVRALHRKIGPRDVYFVMGVPQGVVCTFRARGQVELWDPWTGAPSPIHNATETPDGTRVRMPLGTNEAQLIVFSPGKRDLSIAETDLEETTDVTDRGGKLSVTGYAVRPGRKAATVLRDGHRAVLHGEAAESVTLTLDGDWEFELRPTMDNRWGDFRLPATPALIGAEARRFRYAEESGAKPGWERPETDDSAWPVVTHGFGPMFWKLGPMPANADTDALGERLAALAQVKPDQPVEVGGARLGWTPYSFSWRWGKEGDPGHQGYHGLKENVTDDFICLGKPKDGMNETLYVEESGGTRYFLWTAAVVEKQTRVTPHIGGVKPAAVYLNGRRQDAATNEWVLEAGVNVLVLRYDAPGRGHFVLCRAGAPAASSRLPLSMRWLNEPGLVPFDVRPATARPAGWYRFTAPPGLKGMSIVARGDLQAWVEGRPVTVTRREAAESSSGGATFVINLDSPVTGAARVALRVEQQRGLYAGATLPEPVLLDCGRGLRTLGDWSEGSVLENYSGGAWYRKTFALPAGGQSRRVRLELGDVVATAEVRINGQSAGTRVAPPWTFDLTQAAKEGENQLEVLVYNTLANHYLTVPTRYRGSLRSGLVGPVRVQVTPLTRLEE